MISKRRIENLSILFAVFLTFIVCILAILAMADEILEWDIFNDQTEKIIVLVCGAFGLLILACFIINFMLNLSLISAGIEHFARKGDSKHE